MSAPIGEILNRDPARRDARDRIKITGRINSQFVAEQADGFGPPFPISEGELATAYGLEVAEIESDDSRLCRLDADANERAADKLFQGRVTARPEPDPASPEGVFAAAVAAEAAAAEGESDV